MRRAGKLTVMALVPSSSSGMTAGETGNGTSASELPTYGLF
jgi:hypothetical protein